MIVELLKNWKHEGGKIFKKGEQIEMHPVEGQYLIKKKIAINIKENGNSRKN